MIEIEAQIPVAFLWSCHTAKDSFDLWLLVEFRKEESFLKSISFDLPPL
jgi:hypothetical protein